MVAVADASGGAISGVDVAVAVLGTRGVDVALGVFDGVAVG